MTVLLMKMMRSATSRLPLSGGGIANAYLNQQGFRNVRTMISPLASEVKGQIAKKSPTKVMCESGKTYAWCACGLSGKQPFCDGSHKRSALGLTPLRWTSDATKEVFLCNCKQTNKRPFCDGSHKSL